MAIANKENDNGVVEFQFRQQQQRTKWQSFQNAIYDPATGQFCGRTSKNWGQLLLFYSIFYIILAALFAICMQGLFSTLNNRMPKWTLESSLIGTNPGLGFRPISNRTEEGSLIWYNTTNQTTSRKWVDLMDAFFEPYKVQDAKNVLNCSFHDYPYLEHVCAVNLSAFGNCGPDNAYGYNSSRPCVFLKLNRIFDWKPDYYTEPHEDMPDDLKSYISQLTNEKEKNQIWISCTGESDNDREFVSTFNYYPKGIAGYYYPYRNDDNYLSPIVAVEIVDARPNVVVSIECRAWAKNIIYMGGNLHRAGSVKFEVLIDGPTQKVEN